MREGRHASTMMGGKMLETFVSKVWVVLFLKRYNFGEMRDIGRGEPSLPLVAGQ